MAAVEGQRALMSAADHQPVVVQRCTRSLEVLVVVVTQTSWQGWNQNTLIINKQTIKKSAELLTGKVHAVLRSLQ